MIALLFDLVSGSLRSLAAAILALLIIASVWQAVENESFGASYIAAGFAVLWGAVELGVWALRRRRASPSA